MIINKRNMVITISIRITWDRMDPEFHMSTAIDRVNFCLSSCLSREGKRHRPNHVNRCAVRQRNVDRCVSFTVANDTSVTRRTDRRLHLVGRSIFVAHSLSKSSVDINTVCDGMADRWLGGREVTSLVRWISPSRRHGTALLQLLAVCSDDVSLPVCGLSSPSSKLCRRTECSSLAWTRHCEGQ